MPRRKIIPYNPALKPLARRLRKEGTLGEVLLWKAIKGRAIKGASFYRQRPIDNFIVDFFCPDHMLAIEIDGSSHGFKGEKDVARQKSLESLGVRFLRFTEADVRNDMSAVLQKIQYWLEDNGA